MSQGEVARNLVDIVDEKGKVDNTKVFQYLLSVREKAWEIVNRELSLKEDLACKDIEDIKDLQGNVVGNMHTYTGNKSPIDWVVRSWIGKAETGFTNIHLTCWVNSTIDVPHLGMAWGTAPDVFYYADLMPRYDVAEHATYLDQYLAPMNDKWIKLRQDKSINVFTPIHLYTRGVLSPLALSGLVPLNIYTEKIESTMLDYVNYWVKLVKEAKPVSKKEQAILKARDHIVRKTIVERDPANIIADRMLGTPMRERLVRVLWGAEREKKAASKPRAKTSSKRIAKGKKKK